MRRSSTPATSASKTAKAVDLTPLLSATSAAGRLAISVRTLDRMVKTGEIPCYRFGKTKIRRFKISDVERLLIREKTSDESADDLDSFIINTIKKG